MKKFLLRGAIKKQTEKAFLVYVTGDSYSKNAMSDYPKMDVWVAKSQVTLVESSADYSNFGFSNFTEFRNCKTHRDLTDKRIYIPAWLCNKIGWEYCDNKDVIFV